VKAMQRPSKRSCACILQREFKDPSMPVACSVERYQCYAKKLVCMCVKECGVYVVVCAVQKVCAVCAVWQ